MLDFDFLIWKMTHRVKGLPISLYKNLRIVKINKNKNWRDDTDRRFADNLKFHPENLQISDINDRICMKFTFILFIIHF